MLKVLCVDDEQLTLRYLVSLCEKTADVAETYGFDRAKKACRAKVLVGEDVAPGAESEAVYRARRVLQDFVRNAHDRAPVRDFPLDSLALDELHPEAKHLLREDAVVRLLLVADEAVRPGVGDADLKRMPAWLGRARKLYAVRRMPKGANALSVDKHLRDVAHVAEVEP